MLDKERRQFFRIDDTVGVKIEPIEQSTVNARIDDFWNNSHEFSLRNEFNHELDQHAADLIAIEKDHPNIARYLKVLQKQVDILSEKILPDDSELYTQQCKASISAQGISFSTDHLLQKGRMVEMSLLLLPKKHRVMVLAQVIHCDISSNGQYKTAFNFEHIRDADQEVLIKHIHSLQLKSLIKARNEADE